MILKRFEAVEIQVPSGSTLTRFYFPDQPQLRNARIVAIAVYNTAAISASILTGSTPVTSADLKKSFLTLYSGDMQLVNSLPMTSLNNIQNGTTDGSDPAVFELPEIDSMIVSWTKSYVNLPTALSTTNVAYSFGVYYYLPA
jgi:hypothetical protein